MTHSSSARIRLSTILLGLACLWSCQSTPTGTDTQHNPGRTPGEAMYGGRRAIDHAYLLDLRQLEAERQQALEAGRRKELGPAEMRALEDSFESRRRQLRASWQEARARAAK